MRRTRILALRFLAALVMSAGGRRWIPWVIDHASLPTSWKGRFGASVPVSVARESIAVLPVQGASIVEVGPVGIDDVEALRWATAGRTCRVVAFVDTPDVAEAVAPYVDKVTVGAAPDAIHQTEPDIEMALTALANPSKTVLATAAVLVAAGPNWFNRVIEAATPTSPAPLLRDVPRDPRRWPAWFWGVLSGVGMIVGGLGAAAITLGPVLLWYDRDYLGASVDDLYDINHHLVGFLQHDRITMAGNMIGIEALYIGLAWGGIRQGRVWARNALLISGLVGFPTLFYFLVTGFVEPLHTLLAIGLFPMFLFAVWRKPSTPRWRTLPEGPESERRLALWGQLLLISLWGWRRGERWVWWSLLIGCASGTAPAVAVHFAIGYTSFKHLLPLYIVVLVTVLALALSNPYLTARARG